MNFTPQPEVVPLAALWQVYGDADEVVFEKFYPQLDAQQIAAVCYEARRLAHRLHAHHGVRPAPEVAAIYGIEIVRDHWQAAQGRVIYLAECTLKPPQIRLNLHAVEFLTRFGQLWVEEEAREWFTAERITEVAAAHELYHIIREQTPSPHIELTAHAFARAFTNLPFSALLYHAVLTRLAQGEGN